MNNFDIKMIARKNVLQMQPYSSARDEFMDYGAQMIFLDANESPFYNGVNRYPDTQQRAVKKVLSDLKGININQMVLGNGSDETLDLVFRAFCEPNKDNVITLPPTYGMYGVLANLNAIWNKEITLDNGFQPDVSAILNAVDENTKIIFLCSPNNPTGNSFTEESILEILTKFKGLVVLDEAYIDFSEQESWLKRMEELPNLIIVQTLSKAYGLAGIRLGILYASIEIVSILNKIKPPYNINELTQVKALEELKNYKNIKYRITLIKGQKLTLLKALVQINFIKTIYPTDANFILIKVDNATQRYHQLLEKGLVIRNRTTQSLCENCLRITIGTQIENEQLINVLKSL